MILCAGIATFIFSSGIGYIVALAMEDGPDGLFIFKMATIGMFLGSCIWEIKK